MLLGLVLTETNQPIYSYDTATHVATFVDPSLAHSMISDGISVVVNDSSGHMVRKTAKFSEPNFHEIFMAYSKKEFAPNKFHWKILHH